MGSFKVADSKGRLLSTVCRLMTSTWRNLWRGEHRYIYT